MELRSNFHKTVLVDSTQIDWVPSPIPGVERRMLDRVGGEVARATTIVRYAPGSAFSPHVHRGGEEFIVLEGVFQDEHGDYPTGSYVRNPPTSSHTPGSESGCVIFVKLWQFDPTDRHQSTQRLWSERSDPPHHTVLFDRPDEHVRHEVWPPGTTHEFPVDGGLELLVLEGSIQFGDSAIGRHGWVRVAPHESATFQTAEGARVWMKSRHLSSPRMPPGGPTG